MMCIGPNVHSNECTGCQKIIGLLSSFEFLGWGGVFLGVKIIIRTLGTKKNIW